MATLLLKLKAETGLTNGIGVWELRGKLRGKLCLAEMDENGNALVGEALVLTEQEQDRLCQLLKLSRLAKLKLSGKYTEIRK